MSVLEGDRVSEEGGGGVLDVSVHDVVFVMSVMLRSCRYEDEIKRQRG
jgi:hypothetical protein